MRLMRPFRALFGVSLSGSDRQNDIECNAKKAFSVRYFLRRVSHFPRKRLNHARTRQMRHYKKDFSCLKSGQIGHGNRTLGCSILSTECYKCYTILAFLGCNIRALGIGFEIRILLRNRKDLIDDGLICRRVSPGVEERIHQYANLGSALGDKGFGRPLLKCLTVILCAGRRTS
jgi:hypothetical protein